MTLSYIYIYAILLFTKNCLPSPFSPIESLLFSSKPHLMFSCLLVGLYFLFVIFYATLHLIRVVCISLVCGRCCWLEHRQLHSGYSTGESDFSSSNNSSLPLAPQTGVEHHEPLSRLWCNADGFILCQSHAHNQSCQTVLQPYYIPIRDFHSTPSHSPPLLSFPLPPSTMF